MNAKTPKAPQKITDSRYRFDSFADQSVFPGKQKGRLPAMGWNSWNAFGSGNTEKLTKEMADAIVSLSLDKLGYEYVILDDGCYKEERENGLLANEPVKFPSGFKALSDYIHAKGLKFGMYNDIGTNLCAGAEVGTCGYEKDDARTYLGWGVDFIKVDNCYYLWDNATFSDKENARYTYAPNIRGIKLYNAAGNICLAVTAPPYLTGPVGKVVHDSYVTGVGTFDGTGPDHSPVGILSSEIQIPLDKDLSGIYTLEAEYATGKEEGCGQWLQVAVSAGQSTTYAYDDLLPETDSAESFTWSMPITLNLPAGAKTLRLMNHRRQENTLCSYAALLEGLQEADPENKVLLSLCEWGKTQPQNWGYKVGCSWRILNDITFQVGSDGDPGRGTWESDYTTGVTAQYNKAVIMDEFAGLDRGWNDPDMLMVGMDGLDLTMNRTHFTMWAMMNSPLMLGLDLRRVQKGDDLYNILANPDVIALNQDALGIQAKRVHTTATTEAPDQTYIRDNHRVDVLVKPLADGSLAISFINLSHETWNGKVSVSLTKILEMLGERIPGSDRFRNVTTVKATNLWTREEVHFEAEDLFAKDLPAHDNVTYRLHL